VLKTDYIDGVWIIDAVFRETREKVRRYREMGYYV